MHRAHSRHVPTAWGGGEEALCISQDKVYSFHVNLMVFTAQRRHSVAPSLKMLVANFRN